MSSLRLGYITNGFRDHALEDVFPILRDCGYEGVGITLDVGHLDPFRSSRDDVLKVRALLARYGLQAVIETGGRFVLDPRRKHYPNLLSAEGRERRIDFLLRALEIAEVLSSRVLSFWSGAQDPRVDPETTWRHLTEALGILEKSAAERRVSLAFEPEPGMFIAGLRDFRELQARFPSRALRMTLDLGHLPCTEDPPLDAGIREFAPILDNVHVDDTRGREHAHLPPGEGDLDFASLLGALEDVGYAGLCLVELSRHSHAAPEMAERSARYLRSIEKALGS